MTKQVRRLAVIIVFLVGGAFFPGCSNGDLQTSYYGSNMGPSYGNGTDGNYNLLSASTASDTTTFVNSNTSATRTISANRRIISSDTTSTVLTLGSAFSPVDYDVGDEVMWIVVAQSGTTCSPGTYGFSHIQSYAGSTVTINPPLLAGITPDGNAASASPFCMTELLRVPNFSSLSVPAGLSLSSSGLNLSSGTGGILVLRVNGTLNIQGVIGNTGGTGFTSSPGQQGAGLLGLGVSAVTAANYNGGGAGAITMDGGGGGGNYSSGGAAGAGGNGGGAITECAGMCDPSMKIFMGGAGGGVTSFTGGNGGGIIMIFAKYIMGTGAIHADATSGIGSMSGSGGGAGGTVFITAFDPSGYTGSISATGGSGGTCSSSGNGGGGGSGGLIEVRSCSGSAAFAMNSSPGAGGSGSSCTSGLSGSNGWFNQLISGNACY